MKKRKKWRAGYFGQEVWEICFKVELTSCGRLDCGNTADPYANANFTGGNTDSTLVRFIAWLGDNIFVPPKNVREATPKVKATVSFYF
jgi:hypothetical protein